jgi:KDO2-lipid IV(A) lauroyltransferase
MAKQRNWYVDRLVYVLIRVIVCIVQALPFTTALKLAGILSRLVALVDRRHRLVAEENLRHAFGDQYTDAERTALVHAVYRHFCTVLMEIIFLQRLIHTTTWNRYIKLINGGRLVDRMLSGRAVMIVTGHFGNWEVGGYLTGLFGFAVHAIARKIDNPELDAYLRHIRESTGQGTLDKNEDWDKINQVLANKGVIETLGDQDAGQKGLFVNFFNRPASTHKAVALLSLEHNAPLLVIGVARVAHPLRYHVIVDDLIMPEDYQGRPDAIPAMTKRFTDALERIIRQYPEQYFWLHRRWKHQPQVKKGKRAA